MTLDLGKLVLRVGIAGLMLPHGYAKLQLWLDHGINARFADPLGIGEIPTIILAIIAELICPALVIIGFRTRLAAILPAVTMLVAAFVMHINDPWAKMEFPLLYLVGFAAIILIGPGKWSLDSKAGR